MKPFLYFAVGLTVVFAFVFPGCQREHSNQATTDVPPLSDGGAAKPQEAAVVVASEATSTIDLFDGETLTGWEVTQFGGQGECLVEDGMIVVEPGFPLSGIHSTRDDLPTSTYEIELEAQKLDGNDFFCGLTFPVNESHCSLIVGGWAGPVVGLSMIDDQDAASNETRKLMRFETGQWYRIRLRVLPDRIQTWIDDEPIIDLDLTGRNLSVRNETLPSRPLGICSFQTKAAYRKISLKRLF